MIGRGAGGGGGVATVGRRTSSFQAMPTVLTMRTGIFGTTTDLGTTRTVEMLKISTMALPAPPAAAVRLRPEAALAFQAEGLLHMPTPCPPLVLTAADRVGGGVARP